MIIKLRGTASGNFSQKSYEWNYKEDVPVEITIEEISTDWGCTGKYKIVGVEEIKDNE